MAIANRSGAHDLRDRTAIIRFDEVGRRRLGQPGPSAAARLAPGLLTTALVFLAVAVMLGLVGLSAAEGLLAWDVRFAYLPAAEAVLDGDSPYPALDDPILDEQKGYVYPPQLSSSLLPLTPLPVGCRSGPRGRSRMLALLLLTLRVLEVRDVRCYAAALLWVPAISGVLLANVSIPLAFALAVVWRYRDAVWPPAVALGLAVSAKLLLWPMFVWMLATRRFRRNGVRPSSSALGVTLAAWAAIGFDGLRAYPGSARAALRDPGRAQLLDRRHGVHARARPPRSAAR